MPLSCWPWAGVGARPLYNNYNIRISRPPPKQDFFSARINNKLKMDLIIKIKIFKSIFKIFFDPPARCGILDFYHNCFFPPPPPILPPPRPPFLPFPPCVFCRPYLYQYLSQFPFCQVLAKLFPNFPAK